MKEYKVMILGGGASACMCAMSAKEKNIAMIDLNAKPAKKILVTGNGRCNLTNKNMTSSFFNTNIDKFLSEVNVNKTLNIFNALGLEYYNDDEGRVYPLSNSAKSVQDVIVRNLKNKIDYFGEEKIEEVSYINEKFVIKTSKDIYKAEKLVVATGGNTQNLFKGMDVKFSKTIPSLVALKTKSTKNLSGIKLSNVKVTAINNSGCKKSEIGEVLFKDSGLSGIVIFNLSTLFARDGEFKGKIYIDLLPNVSEKSLANTIERRKLLKCNMDDFFVGMFQNAVANEILKQSQVKINKESTSLTDKELKQLVKTIKNLEFQVLDCYDNNQVFSGGVSLHELNENLEYKKYKNLYFIGEVCDVDGECGGYNLQWAWTSGKIVGESL